MDRFHNDLLAATVGYRGHLNMLKYFHDEHMFNYDSGANSNYMLPYYAIRGHNLFLLQFINDNIKPIKSFKSGTTPALGELKEIAERANAKECLEYLYNL